MKNVLDRKSITINGYEIPMTTRYKLFLWACWGVLPTTLSLAFGRNWFALGWAVFIGVFFHLRNVIVKGEVARGLHDPIYGKHLQRMRQRQDDNDPRIKRMNRVIVVAAILVIILGMILQNTGIINLQRSGLDLPQPQFSASASPANYLPDGTGAQTPVPKQ